MRLITWNVHARTTRQHEQAAFLGGRRPDVVALQEVPASRVEQWRAELTEAGLGFVRTSQDTARAASGRGLLLATRYPAEEIERRGHVLLSARVEVAGREVQVHAVHVPNGSDNGWEKVETLQMIHELLAGRPDALRVLCGDLNTPRAEHPDGTLVTWGQGPGGRLRRDGGAEWDAAERSVLVGLQEHGMVDVYRALHGYAVTERSWVFNRKGVEGGYRLDHVIASPELAPQSARYLHEPRVAGLSDHAALEANFALA